jgi:hypothetical protein
VEADGALYAAEMATGYGDDPDGIQPGTGRIVRRVATDRAEVVATGLDLPAAIDFGPDGALYVSGPTLGADDGSGWIVRLDGAAATPVPVAERLPAVQPCAVAPG